MTLAANLDHDTDVGLPSGNDRPAPILSVIIPMYQEQERILPTLQDVLATFPSLLNEGDCGEVVLVNDGSKDFTARNVRALLGDHPGNVRVRLVEHDRNRGKGAAVRTGLTHALGSWMLVMDADNSTRLVEARLLASRTQHPHVVLVVGSRAVKDARVTTTRLRRVSGRFFHACLCAMGMNLARDTQCGFKLYRRDFAKLVSQRAQEDGFSFDIEHLLLAKLSGGEVREVGIAWTHVDGGTIRLTRDGPRMLRAAWTIRTRVRGLSGLSLSPDHSIGSLPLAMVTQAGARVRAADANAHRREDAHASL